MELKAKLSPDEKLRWANIWYETMLLKITEGVEKKYGPEAKEVIKQAYYEVGKEVATKVKDALKVKGGSPEDYAKIHLFQDTQFWGIKEEVSKDEKGRIVIRVSSCPAQGVFKARDCSMFIPYVVGMFEVINPKLKWEAPKVLTRGDDCCEFIVTEGE